VDFFLYTLSIFLNLLHSPLFCHCNFISGPPCQTQDRAAASAMSRSHRNGAGPERQAAQRRGGRSMRTATALIAFDRRDTIHRERERVAVYTRPPVLCGRGISSRCCWWAAPYSASGFNSATSTDSGATRLIRLCSILFLVVYSCKEQ
jgi:hypothetical protein